MSSLLLILLSAVLVCHYAPAIAGLRPFEESEPLHTTLGMAVASLATMLLATPLGYLIDSTLLVRYDLGYLRTLVFILAIMSVAQVVALALHHHGRWHPLLQSFAPLMTAHCAVLGVALFATARADSFGAALLWGGLTGLAFGVALLMFTALHERLRYANVPLAFREVPVALITVGLMALAFMGFTGLIRD